MKKLLAVATAVVLGAVVAVPGPAEANPICDVYDAVNRAAGYPVQAYCIDDPSPLDDLLELQP